MPTIKIMEVGPRDGLQNEKVSVPTSIKLQFIEKLLDAGLRWIEVTSFVHPKAVPQMADAAEVIAGLPFLSCPSPQRREARRGDCHFSVLTPNMKGLLRALENGVREIAIFTAASETFNQRNIQMSIEESITQFEPMIILAKQEGLWVRGYVSTAFDCPFEGVISKEKVQAVSLQLMELGIDELAIGDTIGKANPSRVTETLAFLLQDIPVAQLALHCHDTYGQAIQNVEAALKLGLTIFDSSTGGLGGCPYAPGAPGNLSTESLVKYLNQAGVETGVDLAKLQEAAQFIRNALAC